MTQLDAGRESLPRTLLERIVSVCDRFEREWRAGKRPAIEGFLPEGDEQVALFERLLLLELDLRREEGETPTPADYRDRFAGRMTLIDAVFGGSASRDVLPGDRSAEAARTFGEEGIEPTDGPARPGLTTQESPGAAGPDVGPGAGRPEGRGDRFTLVREHARGGVGEVWLARDHALGRDVALKRLLATKAGSASLRARFFREAWITGQLQHPGVVPVYELSSSDDGRSPYYTMRFIKGRTFAESIHEFHRRKAEGTAGAGALRELVGVYLQVCQVVAYAHSRGIIHRDLKGQNVALGDYGEVMVLDWGMAKVLGTKGVPGEPAAIGDAAVPGSMAEEETVLTPEDGWGGTHDGSILGTPSYMAPEQALGQLEQVDFRSDVYGLGAMLYEVLTGEPPFRGPVKEVLRQVVHDPPVPPRQRGGEVPAPLEAICLRCLSKSPADRYATASELARDVQRFLADEPVSAYREPGSARVRRWVSRHRTFASVLVATLVVATACLSVATTLLMLSNERETALRERAEGNLGLLMKALDRFFSKLGDDKQLKARGLEKLQHELLAEARALYLQVPPQDGAGPRVQAEKAWVDLRLARITDELGGFTDAITLAHRARGSFVELSRNQPAVLEFREGIAQALDALGRHYQGSHQPDQARESLEQAIAAWERLVAEHPDSTEYRRSYAASMNRLGRMHCIVLHDPPAGRSVLARSLVLCEQLVRDNPHSVAFRAELAEATLLLGYSLAPADFETARSHLEKALAIREQLSGEEPGSFERQSDLLDTCVLVASAYSNARFHASVPLLYGKVREIGDRLAEEHRDVPRFAENRCLIETLYSIHLAQSGEHRRAVLAAEQALTRSPQSGLTLLYAACCLSVASDAAGRDATLPEPARQGCVRDYQGRAIALLRRASETGLFQQPHQLHGLKSEDPDLAPLRGCEEFRRLVADLERKAGRG